MKMQHSNRPELDLILSPVETRKVRELVTEWQPGREPVKSFVTKTIQWAGDCRFADAVVLNN